MLASDTVIYAVQVNGKLRGDVGVPADAVEDEVVAAARAVPNVAAYLDGAEVRKRSSCRAGWSTSSPRWAAARVPSLDHRLSVDDRPAGSRADDRCRGSAGPRPRLSCRRQTADARHPS